LHKLWMDNPADAGLLTRAEAIARLQAICELTATRADLALTEMEDDGCISWVRIAEPPKGVGGPPRVQLADLEWEARHRVQMARGALAGVRLKTDPAPEGEPAPPVGDSIDQLRRVISQDIIHQAITETYDDAERAQGKPPNIKEIPPLVQQKLAAKGFQPPPQTRIQKLAEDKRHKSRRWRQGDRASTKRS
jgi:hypothetical protein